MNTPEHNTIRTAVTALDAWAADVDAVQSARLTAARRRALAPAAAPAWRVWSGAGLAAAFALALGVGLWPQRTPTAALDLVAFTAAEDDLDATTQEFLADDDLELLLWLDGSAEAT